MNKSRVIYQVKEKLFHAAQIPGLLENSAAKLGQDGELCVLVDVAKVFPQPFHSTRIIGIRPGIVLQIFNSSVL